MAMQIGKSPLAGKVKGFASASRGLVGRPIEIRGGRLPAGINGGVAVLSSVGVGMYPVDFRTENLRGQPCFRAAAVAKSPEEHKGQHVRGSQFFLTEPLCDTPNVGGKRKTLADHVNFMREKLTGFGLDYDGLMSGLPEGATDEQALALVEAGCKALTPAERAKSGAAPVYFRFRTWQGKPPVISGPDATGKWAYEDFRGRSVYQSKEALMKANPRAEDEPFTNVDWEGACEFSENGEMPAVQDETGGEATTGEAADASEDGVTAGESPEVSGGETSDDVDLDALAATADEKDVSAQQQIDAIADGLGLTDECGAAATYAEAVEIIRAAQSGADAAENDVTAVGEPVAEEAAAEEEPAADEPWQPAPGEEYRWKPADPKDKSGKKRLKAISVIVEKVYGKNETVTVKSNVTKKPITVSAGPNKGKPLAVKWSELEQA